MSDIQPGDVVVCVDAKPDRADPKANLLVEGRHYRVAVVGLRSLDQALAVAFFCLRSDTPGKGWAFSIGRFRKLNDEPDNAELIERIKACRPINTGAPVHVG